MDRVESLLGLVQTLLHLVDDLTGDLFALGLQLLALLWPAQWLRLRRQWRRAQVPTESAGTGRRLPERAAHARGADQERLALTGGGLRVPHRMHSKKI
jgi:hypothetical protein